MAKIFEEISKANANSAGKPDANLANDSNNLGGIPANEYATEKYVQEYHNAKESNQKKYIDQQDQAILDAAKEYTNTQIRNQDFSEFAELKDVQALKTELSNDLANCKTECASNLKAKTDQIVKDVNANFDDVNTSIQNLNKGQSDLFQSVSNGKRKVAEAITDKGVQTSATDTFDIMAGNIRQISTGGEVDPNFVNTSDGTATDTDILLGKTAYVKGQKIYGNHTCKGIDTSDATATPYDILENKTAYGATGKMAGVLTINTSSGGSTPSYGLSDVEKVYGTVSGTIQRRRMAYENKEQGCVDIARSNRTTGNAPNDFLVYTTQSKIIENNNGENAGKTLGIYADKLSIQTLVAYESEKGYKLDVPEHTEIYTMEELGLTSGINPVEDNGVIVLTLGVSERTSLGSYNLALAVRNVQGSSSNDGLYNIEIFLYEVVYKIDRSNPNDIKAYWTIEDKQPLRITFKTVNSYFCKKISRIIFKEGKDVFALVSGYSNSYPRS